MKLSVPYYSQFIDLQDSFWMLRGCGATCLKMILDFHGKEEIELLDLCKNALANGGYDLKNGWIHDYLVSKAKSFGLDSCRKEDLQNLDEIIYSLDSGNPVIVSVEKRVLEQTRFHMVVMVGYEREEVSESSTTSHLPSITSLYYHEPESTDKERGQYRKCTKEAFMNYWRGKAIFIG